LDILILGSVAAGVQSVVYGGFTTGIFSVCQSIGATAVVSTNLLFGGGASVLAGTGMLATGYNALPKDEKSSSDSEQEKTAPPTGFNMKTWFGLDLWRGVWSRISETLAFFGVGNANS